MSWAAATDLGRNFSGSVSGWMNLWGNIGALLSPLLAGMLVDIVGWTVTLELVIIPVIFAIVMWFFVKPRSEEHTSELQSRFDLVCRLLLEKKKDIIHTCSIY